VSIAIRAERISKCFRRQNSRRPLTLHEALVVWRRDVWQPRSVWAVRDASLSVERGSMVGLVGANGSGKSTLLRLIGGVIRPDEGHLEVCGRVGGLLELGSGFHPELTGRENILTNGVLNGLTRRELAGRFDAIVEFSELADVIDEPLRVYSTGMQMRLAFAVAVHVDADILLVDEVLSVGDLAFERKCVERIAELREAGCTIIFASHSTSLVAELCDEALWMSGGEVMAHGPAHTVTRQYVASVESPEGEKETRRRTPKTAPVLRTSTGAELRVHVNRFGSLEVELTDVRMLDARGDLVAEIESGESLRVELDFSARAPVASPIFQVYMYRDNGPVSFVEDTSATGLVPEVMAGDGKAVLHFDRLALAEGLYWIEVGVYTADWSYAYDYHSLSYSIRVRPSAQANLHTPTRPRWEVEGGRGAGSAPAGGIASATGHGG
jgi:lipopolysaccharide transport system ATP-binding protein